MPLTPCPDPCPCLCGHGQHLPGVSSTVERRRMSAEAANTFLSCGLGSQLVSIRGFLVRRCWLLCEVAPRVSHVGRPDGSESGEGCIHRLCLRHPGLCRVAPGIQNSVCSSIHLPAPNSLIYSFAHNLILLHAQRDTGRAKGSRANNAYLTMTRVLMPSNSEVHNSVSSHSHRQQVNPPSSQHNRH